MLSVCREFPRYAPAGDVSVKFCFANNKSECSPVSQLTLFDAAHGKYDHDMMGEHCKECCTRENFGGLKILANHTDKSYWRGKI